MRKLLMSAVVASVFAIAAHARAATVFSDNFDTENGGNPTLNYYSLSNWTVPQGSVDLIGNGYFDFLPGNGLYIDLDGSTNQAGTMVSKPIALAAGSYVFQFDLAGSHRGPMEPVTASVSSGNVVLDSQLFNLPSDQGFTLFTLPFTMGAAGNATLSFAEIGNSNQGQLLDNVSVSSLQVGSGAPLPSAAWGGLVLMSGILAAKVRKQRIACIA
jgi:hypothetical protein